MPYYFISLGSNVHPEQNVVRMLEGLRGLSTEVDISRIEKTKAMGFKSDNYFLNLVVRIYTELSQPELKERLVSLEEKLGRDRSDPNRKLKDRPADLDVLFSLEKEKGSLSTELIPEEPYVLPAFLDLARHLGLDCQGHSATLKQDVSLQLGNISIGNRALHLPRA